MGYDIGLPVRHEHTKQKNAIANLIVGLVHYLDLVLF